MTIDSSTANMLVEWREHDPDRGQENRILGHPFVGEHAIE